MENNEWTEKQRKAYEALKASVEQTIKARTISFGKTPPSGWNEKDRVR